MGTLVIRKREDAQALISQLLSVKEDCAFSIYITGANPELKQHFVSCQRYAQTFVKKVRTMLRKGEICLFVGDDKLDVLHMAVRSTREAKPLSAFRYLTSARDN